MLPSVRLRVAGPYFCPLSLRELQHSPNSSPLDKVASDLHGINVTTYSFSREQHSFRPAVHDQLAGEQSDGGQGLRERSGHCHSL